MPSPRPSNVFASLSPPSIIDKKLIDELNKSKHSIAEASEIAAKFGRFREKRGQLDSSAESLYAWHHITR